LDKKILVIVPAYNEQDSIERVINKLIKEYPELDYVIINDGSRDNTAEICKKNGYNVINLPINLGLSGAVQTGMKYAIKHSYDYAIQFDGDGQHNPEYITKMAEKAYAEGLNVVIGSRFVDESKPKSARMLGSNIIAGCIKLTTGRLIKDPTSGMRLFDRDTMKKFVTQINYSPEPDTIAYLLRCGAKIGEYQVHMNDREAGESYLNLSNSIKYMVNVCSSILVVQWFRKKEVV